MRTTRCAMWLLIGAAVVGCDGGAPTGAGRPGAPALAVGGPVAHATGGGWYLLLNAFPTQFAFNAKQFADGRASGRFHHAVTLTESDGNEYRIEFHGEVTCVSQDVPNNRAWIGGVVTKNNSTHPSFQGPIHQPGRDIWFRVVDYGEGGKAAQPDRTSFVGFEGALMIPTSAEYCRLQPWGPGDARTWPVTRGNIQVH